MCNASFTYVFYDGFAGMGWPLILGPRVVGVLGSEESWSQGSGGSILGYVFDS